MGMYLYPPCRLRGEPAELHGLVDLTVLGGAVQTLFESLSGSPVFCRNIRCQPLPKNYAAMGVFMAWPAGEAPLKAVLPSALVLTARRLICSGVFPPGVTPISECPLTAYVQKRRPERSVPRPATIHSQTLFSICTLSGWRPADGRSSNRGGINRCTAKSHDPLPAEGSHHEKRCHYKHNRKTCCTYPRRFA